MITTCRGVQNMDDLEYLLTDVEKGFAALQKVQDLYDSDLWAINSPPFAKYRHVVIHISVLAGELSKLSEALEHQTTTKDISDINLQPYHDKITPWIADLLLHAAQLANLANQAMYPLLVNRIKANALRFGPNSRFGQISTFRARAAEEDNTN